MDIREECARLSEDVYKTHNSNYQTLNGWKELTYTENDINSLTGFAAAAYYRIDANGQPKLNSNGQLDLVVSYRGTDNTVDMTASWVEIALGQKVGQVNLAETFYNSIQSILDTDLPGYTTKKYITGHSLGGGLAEVVGAKNGIETYTFNAIGMKHLANDFNLSSTAYYSNIHNYATQTDIVSSLFDHLGSVNYVDAFQRDANGNPTNEKVGLQFGYSQDAYSKTINSQVYINLNSQIDDSHSLQNFYNGRLNSATSGLNMDGQITRAVLGAARLLPTGLRHCNKIT